MPTYEQIGKTYDDTRRADPYIARRLASHLKANLKDRYLDLACGTGNYTIALRYSGIQISGVDQSVRMLSSARRKDPSINWSLGTAEALPFRSGSFSGAICVLAIHHFENFERAFQEVARVIVRGRFVIFTSTSEQLKRFWLNEYFPTAMRRSIDRMPSKNEIMKALKNAGFIKI